MKTFLKKQLLQAISQLKINGTLDNQIQIPSFTLNPTQKLAHGDYASNIALVLAKAAKTNPRTLAENIVNAIPTSQKIISIEIADPGFVNFFLSITSYKETIRNILSEGPHFGENTLGEGKRIHIEYVSANPTGPLHVGHGRGAAYGASLANLLRANGFSVYREYYVNDTGRQMDILAWSVWVSYLKQIHHDTPLPSSIGYQGGYIVDMAKQLYAQYDTRFDDPIAISNHPMLSEQNNQTKEETERFLDDCIVFATDTLGDNEFSLIRTISRQILLDDIKNDLEAFGVTFDNWFLESSLSEKNLITDGIQRLKAHGYVYQKDGATWFQATALGDEKDRVLIRKNGASTYFAADVAYHLYKYQQGFDRIIDILGADHHGYVSRIRSVLKGVGEDPNRLSIFLVQFAALYRGAEKLPMSTRAGKFITLKTLRDEVGNDATRFFYVMRKPEHHLNFDVSLATSKSNDNPVFYIQYAHARISSIKKELSHQNMTWSKEMGLEKFHLLSSDYERMLLLTLTEYPDVIKNAGLNAEPHLLAHYLYTLANQFHTYYNAKKFLIPEINMRHARLCLIFSVQQVIANGLTLLDVSAPNKM